MIINAIADFITSVILHLGYPGIFLLMAFESACIPIPSEIIMPFSGFLVSSSEMNFCLVVVAGSAGNLLGSLLAWRVGFRGGRPLVEKYGRYILLSQRDLESSDRFFKRYGESAVFFSRLLPVIRTFISLPAGIAKMDFKKFSLYTLAGCVPFTTLLTYAGLILKENWEALSPYFHKFDLIIALLIILAIIWFVFRHLRKKSN